MNPSRPRSYQLLVFDWDGTLSDSLRFIVAAVRGAIRDMDLPARDEDEIRGIIGLGLFDASNRLFPGMSEPDCHRLAENYRQHYRILAADPVPLYPGAAEIIPALHEQGYMLAVATGKSRRGLNQALGDSGLSRYFALTRCADETFSKPHPQMLEELMDLAGVSAAETLMIGDSEHDMQMARNAGVEAVALAHGALPASRLLEFQPVACFEALHELPPWLASGEAHIPAVNP